MQVYLGCILITSMDLNLVGNNKLVLLCCVRDVKLAWCTRTVTGVLNCNNRNKYTVMSALFKKMRQFVNKRIST